jgi:hypothetical protein
MIFEEKRAELATKKDVQELSGRMTKDLAKLRVDLSQKIYWTSLSQLLAIIASVISLMFLLRK